MTNEEVRRGFAEVYNEFWCKYKNRQPCKDSPEWDRVHKRYQELYNKYPFMQQVLAEMIAELDQRMRKREGW